MRNRVFLVLLLSFLFQSATFAQDALSPIEQKLTQATHESEPLEQRVSRLESIAYGSPNSGDIQARYTGLLNLFAPAQPAPSLLYTPITYNPPAQAIQKPLATPSSIRPSFNTAKYTKAAALIGLALAGKAMGAAPTYANPYPYQPVYVQSPQPAWSMPQPIPNIEPAPIRNWNCNTVGNSSYCNGY